MKIVGFSIEKINHSLERSTKKLQLWKKAIVHFMLCFVMGFFTGFALTGKASIFSNRVSVSNRSDFSAKPLELLHQTKLFQSYNRSLLDRSPDAVPEATSKSDHNAHDDHHAPKPLKKAEKEGDLILPRRLVIIVTPTSMKDRRRGVLLRRLATTLRLVPQSLLWVVVEQQSDSDEVFEILRKTGIMYRHLVIMYSFLQLNLLLRPLVP